MKLNLKPKNKLWFWQIFISWRKLRRTKIYQLLYIGCFILYLTEVLTSYNTEEYPIIMKTIRKRIGGRNEAMRFMIDLKFVERQQLGTWQRRALPFQARAYSHKHTIRDILVTVFYSLPLSLSLSPYAFLGRIVNVVLVSSFLSYSLSVPSTACEQSSIMFIHRYLSKKPGGRWCKCEPQTFANYDQLFL